MKKSDAHRMQMNCGNRPKATAADQREAAEEQAQLDVMGQIAMMNL